MLLKEIASLVGGKLVGDGSLNIKSFSTIEDAAEGELVFVLEDKYLADALNSKASAFVVSDLPAGKAGKASISGKNAVLVKNPRLAMAKALSHYVNKPKIEAGVHKLACIEGSASLGKNVSVGAFSYIGEQAKVGDNTVIHPNVTIYNNVEIGKNCIIHSGARIGVDGFGFVPTGSGFEKIPQIGSVVIDDNVEIYSNVCIARGTLGNTVIGSGTKIDNLTHIAHNCKIGRNCAITGLVGFAGSVTVEDGVTIGGQAGFSGHITVGKNTVVMAKSGVTKDVPPNSIVSGFPAQDHKDELGTQAALRRLSKKNKK